MYEASNLIGVVRVTSETYDKITKRQTNKHRATINVCVVQGKKEGC